MEVYVKYERALEVILTAASPLGTESIPLRGASGRVLAEDLVADRTSPPLPLSAMDGYAVRSADSKAVPATLKLTGEIPAERMLKKAEEKKDRQRRKNYRSDAGV
jgi:molybdopterin molybdotransferase